MSDFKTTPEIWQYLLDGGKITFICWTEIKYIHIVDGFVVTDQGDRDEVGFRYPLMWCKYPKPKQPPLILHDGIDVTKLQTREGGEVLFVVFYKPGPYTYLAVIRDRKGDIRFFEYTSSGTHFLYDEDKHDIIWKEGTT